MSHSCFAVLDQNKQRLHFTNELVLVLFIPQIIGSSE